MRFSHDTLLKIRLLQAYQESLVELLEPYAAAKRIIDDVKPSIDDNLTQLAPLIRDYVGVSFSKKVESPSADSAFKLWRHALEVCGVYTFKDSLKDSFIEALDVTVQTIERVRKQLVEEGFDAVLSRREYTQKVSRKKIDGEVEAHLIALSCSEAPKSCPMDTLSISRYDYGTWIWESIYNEAIRQTLKKTKLNPG